ncbi:MAG TPA: transketolase C-terminal domain-containing protein [Vicinamibacterales bacterium]|nr:transketolase C-terminal domain-containing protein [Vicinamibacterales bacterium]
MVRRADERRSGRADRRAPRWRRDGSGNSGSDGPVTYEDRLNRIAEANPDVVVMTAENRAAIRTLPDRLGSRFIDVGIAEQTLVGAAAGLALRGRVPVVHALASFLTMRAFEFIRTDVGIAQLPVKLVGACAGFLSEANGPTHQALEDIALMRAIPGMTVCCPADEDEMLDALANMVVDRAPWYVRYNARKPAFRHHTPLVPGTVEVVTEGTDVALLTYGCLTRECYEAARRLADAGVATRLLNMRTLKPVDERAILCAVRETSLVVTVEDHFATGGLATIVAEVAASNSIAVRLHSIALAGRWFAPALLADVLEYEGFTGEQLARRVGAAFAAR